MDTTEEYCKMCDCPEIQNSNIQIYTDDEFYHGYIDDHEVRVWLPRQDQLQEMIKSSERVGSWELCIAFFRFFERFCADGFCMEHTTMEQLWLFFVMSKLHRKRWENGQWVTK